MKKKVPVKTFYLIAVISVGLIGLAIGSTYAMFTKNVSIDNPISLTSNLSYSSELLEVIDVEVNANETKKVQLNVSNTTGSTLHYAIWYMTDSAGISTSTTSETPIVGTIEASSNGVGFTIEIDVVNSGNEKATVQVGISGSAEKVVLSDKMRLILEGPLDATLAVNTTSLIFSSEDYNKNSSVGKFNYTYKGDGKLVCSSSNEDIATCEVNTRSRAVTVVPKSAGDVNITLGATKGEVFKEAKSTTVSVKITEDTPSDSETPSDEKENETDTTTSDTSQEDTPSEDATQTE